MQAQLDTREREIESFKQELETEAMEQISALETQLLKSHELLEKAQVDVEALKAQKKEQSLKVAKQAKENLMKHKEEAKILKQAKSEAVEFKDKFEAQKAVLHQLTK